MSNTLSLLGRILIAALFIYSGIDKAMAFQNLAATLAGKGLPYPDVVAVLTIAVEIGGGLLLLPRFTARYGAIILAAFSLAAAILFHDFWARPPAEYTGQLTHFLKNIAIIGGLLHIVAEPAPARLSQP